MITSHEKQKNFIVGSVWRFFGSSLICFGFFLVCLFEFMRWDKAKILAPFSYLLAASLIIGLFVRYRSTLSTKFWFFCITYYAICFSFLLGGTIAYILAKFIWLDRGISSIFLIYQATMFFSIVAGFYLGLTNIKSKNNTDYINFRSGYASLKYYIFSSKAIREHKDNSSIYLILAIAVNIPLIFHLLTGARENSILLLAPLYTISFSWMNTYIFGPQLAFFYTLIKYEKQTGRHFVNADYEDIQELRRTFFLSRWLMKDYKPSNPRKTT